MNIFRVFVIVLAFSIIAGAIVHIRLKNWHYAYLINQLYDKNERLQQEYTQIRLELARYQNPENLLDRLKEMNLSLEGLGMTTQPVKAATIQLPAKPASAKTSTPAAKTTKTAAVKPVKTSKTSPKKTNPARTH
jgi:hypothetical protein